MLFLVAQALAHSERSVCDDAAGSHFAAITDPGSGLEALAAQLGFRHIFRNDPNIGGRYSALSFYGLVAAGAVGIDLNRLLDRAQAALDDPQPGLQLGAFLGAGSERGRDKLTLISTPGLQAAGAWIEQLIAESTGKDGTALLPVDLSTGKMLLLSAVRVVSIAINNTNNNAN